MSSPLVGTVVRLVDLCDTPIDVHEVLALCEDRAAGGIDVFIGRVRDHDSDRAVLGLDYTAHPSALEQLREVCEEVAAAHDLRALAAVHRTGPLAIGDVAVVCVVAADHRDDAFVACRTLIDTLKQRVPIWKHQRFADGDEEWVGAGA